MFNSKLEVDRHVENCLRKINSDTEHNLRCFAFAKLYFKVGDYEQARRYVSIYLNVKPMSAEAQHLLGKALEKLGKLDAALDAYRTSLDLDPKQNSLILKICELLTMDNINFDQSGARYFCERAQDVDPYNPVVFTLKERLILSENKDPNEVSKLLLKELETRPANIDIRVRLLRHLLQNNQIQEAYKHAHDIEQKNLSIFANSLSWYETVAEVLMRYQRDTSLNGNLNWEFWILLIGVLDKLVSLSLDERCINDKISTECVATVFNFDQTLKVASDSIGECPDKHLSQEFMMHYRGQLCLHMATLLFKQAKKELIKYKEASQITLPLLFAAYHLQPADLQCLWYEHTSETNKQLVQRWHREASFRCSQAGHLLVSVSKDRKSSVLEKATQGSAGLWREQLLKKIFVTRDQQTKIKSSYFATCPQFVELTIRLPDLVDVIKYDQVAQLVYPDSLHHYIWIGLSQKLPHFKCSVFSGLNYSVKNLNLSNCSAESLNILDIQAFLYCSILCVQQQIEESKHNIYYPSDRPSMLPAAISGQLGTLNQAKWLVSAYKMYKNDYGCNFGEVRLILIRGIEVVRCVGNHGLDVKLLVNLAKTFSESSKTLTKQSEIEFNDARAELYWTAALPLLEKLKNNQVISHSSNRLFEYKSKEMALSQVLSYIDEGNLFRARQLMKKKEYEKALEFFEGLRDPYASFYQAQIYKLKAEEQTSQNRENVTSEMRSQNIILLSRARDCLYLTLDRLRDPAVDRKHPLNSQLGTEIEKIERMLSRIDPDICLNRNECDGMSDENVSSIGSMGDHFTYGFGSNAYANGHLTPRHDNHLNSTPLRLDNTRREARPSPERLDAQLRQLAASKDTTVHHILEQNKFVVESHRALLDEIRGFKDAVNNLTSSVDELKGIKGSFEDLKGIKKSVDELKNAVDDLQNITDVVSEMKKELAELKKDTIKIKSNQLSDEDLYALDEEYGTDYNAINSNVPGLTPNLYPNLGRIQPANSLPYGPPTLYHGVYHPMLHYPGLGLQTGPLAFGPENPMADFRTISSLSQTLNQPNPYPPHSVGLPQTVLPPIGLTQSGLGQLVAGQPILSNASYTSISSTTVTPQSTSVFSSTSQTFLHTTSSSQALPVNVVITTSDPLPSTRTTTVQPILSVTVPPQHLKSNQQKIQPHNYQIQLPTTSVSQTVMTPSVMNQPPLSVTTLSILSNVAPPVYSAIADKSPSKNTSLGVAIEKSLSQSFSNDENNKCNISSTSVDDHDPCPNFKPIIPLPDEVPVNTGEENEIILYEERAKLFRYANKEWRERGVGILKLLKNLASGKVRFLMRRDQIHKICANHFLTKDMTLSPMNRNDKAYIWAANDYADQEMVLEKLCAKFKTAVDAQKFYQAFEDAKAGLPANTVQAVTSEEKQSESQTKHEGAVSSLGGFVFTSTPTFKPKDEAHVGKTVTSQETLKLSPFATFSFNKQTTFSPPKSDFKPVHKINENLLAKLEGSASPKIIESQSHDSYIEDFEPAVDFKPIIPLPELIEIKTGEENAEVLFENNAKLLRYDSTSKEWKERGIGQMKVLKCDSMIRLVMRRDQVHKVCCNHQLLKNVEFSTMTNNPKAIYWYAQDFSDGVLAAEMFAARYKTVELAQSFQAAVKLAQGMLDENSTILKKGKTPIINVPPNSNESNVEKKVKGDTEAKKTPEISFGKQIGWGDKFKPKSGSWECKICYIVNDSKCNYCVACDTPKNDNIPKKESDDAVQFSFIGTKGNDSQAQQPKSDLIPNSKPISTWGDAFKPKEGTWECRQCYLRNDAAQLYCISCENPKNDSVPKKETFKGITLDTTGSKFNFGIPSTIPKTPANTPITTTSFTFGTPITKSATTFSFDTPKTVVVPSTEVPLNLTGNKSFTFSFGNEKKDDDEGKDKDKFIFGSPQKHTFEFTPRSPRRQSSGPGDEESEGSYVEEEEDNIYFKPVIPLPDKVETKTGEEEEDILYCHRAKLFRFVDAEWKERGIGDVKILLQRDTGKLRVVMRREQVLKLCLNHSLTTDVKYTMKDDKTWLFSAADFSEGEIQHCQFCLRFKKADIAQEFKKAIDDTLQKSMITDKSEKSSINIADSDVEIVFETTVTPEEEAEALTLGLPPKFMSYRQLKDCTCDECKKDDVLLKELFISSPASKPPTKSSPISQNDNNDKKPQTIRDLLSKPSILGNPNQTNVFSTTAQFSSPGLVNAAAAKTNFFGNNSGQKTPTATEAFKNFSFSLNTSASEKQSSGFLNTQDSIFSKTVFGASSPKIFGSPVPSGGSIFGGSTFSTAKIGTGSGGGDTLSTDKKNIFGAPTSSFSPSLGTPRSSLGSVFQDSSSNILNVTTSSSEFGTPNITLSTNSATTKSSIFGGPTSTTGSGGSIFGNGSISFGQSATPVFGGRDYQASSNSKQNVATLPLIADETTSNSVNQSIKIVDPVKEVKKVSEAECVLNYEGNLTFANLAKSSNDESPIAAFQETSSNSNVNPFAHLGSGTPVFGAVKPPAKREGKKNYTTHSGDEGEEVAGDDEYDPYYEPIVPLPEAIVVSTGEEEEEVIFNERTKLYRYDADLKEWKERGVGQLKILHHLIKHTYRFLLRREQVHKVVLNQLITLDLDLQPMITSDRAWLWGGYNYSEEVCALEKLAARFKNSEISKKFYVAVQDALTSIRDQSIMKLIPSTIENFGAEDVSGDDERESLGEEEDYDNQEEDYDDEDDRSLMYRKKCVLSEQDVQGWTEVCPGEVAIYYDPEIFGAKICFTDDNNTMQSNTIIGRNTVMNIEDKCCTWRAIEWANHAPKWRNLRVTFDCDKDAGEFHMTYLEGTSYAEQSDIVDEMTTFEQIE